MRTRHATRCCGATRTGPPGAAGPAISSRGFSLIEVLVAMLVLASGVLGVAALQLKGMQFNQDAMLRSQINFLAYDLVDRIRTNSANAADYAFTSWTTPSAASPCTVYLAADAANDTACWSNQVSLTLPDGIEVRLIGSGGMFSLRFRWQDRNGESHDMLYAFSI